MKYSGKRSFEKIFRFDYLEMVEILIWAYNVHKNWEVAAAWNIKQGYAFLNVRFMN